MATSSNSTPPILSNESRSLNPTTQIALYLKDSPQSQPLSTFIEVSRIPMMGEFIEIGGTLYRVFLVCHQPESQESIASIAAVKTPWESCQSLIETQSI
ncbi:hypothetical protein PMG71_19075 [Roseofilum sp. BLCC_M154]|uniref:Uncharacterized protein n=1 Tax=Roseofilum acuticapitatum BLCC-M154 TaxID=3022444 RepID=A0ABT7AXA3_9CYAN|nr:hypothetical protein [Roseofilum acuticapitatum]MDJ1171537.1 hypothetical protein [Roseofilum acuticapitatum BLCC-M154]